VFSLNLPNFLTVLRILLVPVLVVALLAEGGRTVDIIAAVVFASASVTDALDGYLARSRSQSLLRQADGPGSRQAADHRQRSSPWSPSDRVAAWVAMVIVARRVRGHRGPDGRPLGGGRDRRQLVGQARDRRAGGDDPAADPDRALAGLGRRARLRDGGGHGSYRGVDYFFGMRRLLREAEARRRTRGAKKSRGREVARGPGRPAAPGWP
jgi:CDP-diacylglycerol--glycerol-3-phosphate 3-phosphatidyltransferase